MSASREKRKSTDEEDLNPVEEFSTGKENKKSIGMQETVSMSCK